MSAGIITSQEQADAMVGKPFTISEANGETRTGIVTKAVFHEATPLSFSSVEFTVEMPAHTQPPKT